MRRAIFHPWETLPLIDQRDHRLCQLCRDCRAADPDTPEQIFLFSGGRGVITNKEGPTAYNIDIPGASPMKMAARHWTVDGNKN